MGVNVGEGGRTHKTNGERALYSGAAVRCCLAQPGWHVFSRFWHNIWGFFRIPKGMFFKNCSTPHPLTSKHAFCRTSQTILVFYLKSCLSTVKKKKKHFHWTSYNPPSNFCKALALLGRAQAKIQHLSSQRSNKAPKSGAFTIIQYRKASRNPPFSQVVRTSSSLFLNFSSF